MALIGRGVLHLVGLIEPSDKPVRERFGGNRLSFAGCTYEQINRNIDRFRPPVACCHLDEK
jgi:hypothetical protein